MVNEAKGGWTMVNEAEWWWMMVDEAERWWMCTKSGVNEGRAYLCRLYAGVNEVTPKMALLNQKAFERKLQNMSSTQDSVQTVSLWMIHHKKHAMDMGKIWLDQLKKGKVRPPSGASPGLFTICVYWQIRRMTRFSFLLELHSCTFRLQLR